jgi:hypothetical protein
LHDAQIAGGLGGEEIGFEEDGVLALLGEGIAAEGEDVAVFEKGVCEGGEWE